MSNKCLWTWYTLSATTRFFFFFRRFDLQLFAEVLDDTMKFTEVLEESSLDEIFGSNGLVMTCIARHEVITSYFEKVYCKQLNLDIRSCAKLNSQTPRLGSFLSRLIWGASANSGAFKQVRDLNLPEIFRSQRTVFPYYFLTTLAIICWVRFQSSNPLLSQQGHSPTVHGEENMLLRWRAYYVNYRQLTLRC